MGRKPLQTRDKKLRRSPLGGKTHRTHQVTKIPGPVAEHGRIKINDGNYLLTVLIKQQVVDFAVAVNRCIAGQQICVKIAVPFHQRLQVTGGLISDYAERLLSANWYRHFPQSDNRHLLRWKERFATLTNHVLAINFYSSGEEILRSGNGDLPNLFDEVWDRELVWVYNEMNKGTTSLAASLTGDVHAGWGFNREYMRWDDPGGPAHPPHGQWIPMSTTLAESLSPEEIVQEPFFRRFSTGDSDFPLWLNGSWLYGPEGIANPYLPALPPQPQAVDQLKNHAKILGEAVPAHSAPTGSRSLPNIPLLSNIDLDEVFRDDTFWPVRAHPGKRDRWLHGDYSAPAVSHVAGLYLTCIEQINYTP